MIHGHYMFYGVFVQNIITHEVVESIKRYKEDFRFTKTEAIKAAKEKAISDNLPFDIRKDIMSYTEATQGPEKHCLICQTNKAHTFSQHICNECLRDIKNVVRQRDTDNQWLLPMGKFISSHQYREQEEEIISAIFEILNISFSKDYLIAQEHHNMI